MEPWWVCRSLVAELYHYYEEQDPDQTSHLNANLDPDILLIKGKKFYRYLILCKFAQIFFLPQFKNKKFSIL